MIVEHKPLVSVIIPTYNRASLIIRAIKSVLCQTFTDFELIVVDDGSTDNTVSLIRKFDYPIRIIQHQRNYGVSQARNSGLDASKGTFVAFLDSDDEWLSEKLSMQINAMFKQPDPYNCLCYCKRVKKNSKFTTIGPNRGLHPSEHFLWYILGPGDGAQQPSSLLLAKSVAREIRFDTTVVCEDKDFCLRLWSRGIRFIFVDKILVIYHMDFSRNHLLFSITFDDSIQWLNKRKELIPDKYKITFTALAARMITGKRKWLKVFRALAPAVGRCWLSPQSFFKTIVFALFPFRYHHWIYFGVGRIKSLLRVKDYHKN